MSCYVDTMRARFGGMIMCHMIADSREELMAMADKIGLPRKWVQGLGTHKEHFDVCLTKRSLAIQQGALEVSQLELGRKLVARRTAPTLSRSPAPPSFPLSAKKL